MDNEEEVEYYRNYCGKEEYCSQEGWATLPEELLVEILDHILIRYRYRACMTCHAWYRAFKAAGSWRTFVYRDLVFTRRRFTLHSGWQPMIDHYRLRFLVNQKTKCWRSLVIQPVSLLFNLYEFLRVLTNFGEYYEHENKDPLVCLKSFEFNWSLKFQTSDQTAGPTIYGTGGRVLKQLTHFLSHLRGLEKLHLRQLLLDKDEADAFLMNLLSFFDQTLDTLSLRNLTKGPHSLMHVGLFMNLTKLVVSPQHLNADVVSVLGDHARLVHLVIVQDENTKMAIAVPAEAWLQFRKSRQKPVEVHLRIEGRCESLVVWQPMAPVVSIVYSNPAAKLTTMEALTIADNYADTLKVYVQKGFQRRYRSKLFHERADTPLILMLRSCPKLALVGIRERLSTATLLYAAHLCSYKQFQLYVRKNALVKRSDWPYNSNEWSNEFYTWLTTNSRNYESTFEQFQLLLGSGSKPLNDNEYMHIFK